MLSQTLLYPLPSPACEPLAGPGLAAGSAAPAAPAARPAAGAFQAAKHRIVVSAWWLPLDGRGTAFFFKNAVTNHHHISKHQH